MYGIHRACGLTGCVERHWVALMDSRSTRLLCGLLLSAIAVACSSGGVAVSTSTSVSTTSTSPPTPVPAVSASPPPECPNTEGGSCLGPLTPGTYTTTKFQPALTYRVPAGWGNFEDLAGNFQLLPPGSDLSGSTDFVGVYTSIQAEAPRCPGPAGEGLTTTAIANWITAQPDLEVTQPRPVSIGGLSGVVLDIRLVKGFKPYKNVGFDLKGRCVIMGVSPSGFEHGVDPGETMRLYLLKYADPLLTGKTLAIEIADYSGGGNRDTYSAVVERFRFSP
jgi:hypothetical protein